ncbi:hypothetical protein EXIGLDRAFT_611708, partial [Exidia glandulosa HHB12029]
TWLFTTSHLTETMSEAWEALEPTSAEILMSITCLPQVFNARQLPYRGSNDLPYFIVPRVPAHLIPEEKYETGEHLLCRLCDTEVVIEKMRSHVGRHILLKARNLPDPLLDGHPPIGVDPCGFCGRSGCFTVLSVKGKALTIHSSCGYHYQRMKYALASVSTKSSPCTNVPIHCALCPVSKSGYSRTIWKYNAAAHLLDEHSDNTYEPEAMARMFIAMHIERDEESRMNIPSSRTTAFRTSGHLPDSDGIAELRLQQVKPNEKTSGLTRARAPTTESETAAGGSNPRPLQRARTGTLGSSSRM